MNIRKLYSIAPLLLIAASAPISCEAAPTNPGPILSAASERFGSITSDPAVECALWPSPNSVARFECVDDGAGNEPDGFKVTLINGISRTYPLRCNGVKDTASGMVHSLWDANGDLVINNTPIDFPGIQVHVLDADVNRVRGFSHGIRQILLFAGDNRMVFGGCNRAWDSSDAPMTWQQADVYFTFTSSPNAPSPEPDAG